MARKKPTIEEVPMELTPMIDVVFLLLIFFLVTLKFKVLEGKLPTFLPKDVGVNASPLDDMMEKMEIKIFVDSSRPQTAPEFGVFVTINAVRMPSLRTFHERVRERRVAEPELRVTIYPQKGINYEQVIKVVDEIVRADVTDITFAGVAFDS